MRTRELIESSRRDKKGLQIVRKAGKLRFLEFASGSGSFARFAGRGNDSLVGYLVMQIRLEGDCYKLKFHQ